MPRPAQGYLLADGKTRVTGWSTIAGRFKEAGGLINWAWQCGRDGLDIREVKEQAADAGTLAHRMVECWIHKLLLPQPAITDVFDDRRIWPETADYDEDTWKHASNAFQQWLKWYEGSRLTVVAQEISLVSEALKVGGTLDAILKDEQGREYLGDWKTSKAIYPEFLVQMGGYLLNWEEAHPDRPLAGVHLCKFSKEHGDFSHHFFEDLTAAKRQAVLLREAYEIDKQLKRRVG